MTRVGAINQAVLITSETGNTTLVIKCTPKAGAGVITFGAWEEGEFQRTVNAQLERNGFDCEIDLRISRPVVVG